MFKHFEELWEQCEKFHEENSSDDTVVEIIDDLMLSVTLYKALHEKQQQIPEEDRKNVKSHLLGEILFKLTHLSLRDDVNVFSALETSLRDSKIELHRDMYK
jgi:hypothetical protein